MRYFPLIFITGLLYSCTENKTVSIKSKAVLQKEKVEDSRSRSKAEIERDSIQRLYFFNKSGAIKNAPIIDPKKIDGAFFDTLNFNKVIACSYDGSHEQVLIHNLTIVDQLIALNQEQANTILSLLSRKSTFGTYSSGCFEPRFALLLYNDQGSILQISICMACNNLYYDPKINEMYGAISKKGRKGIISFCKELKFPYGELKE